MRGIDDVKEINSTLNFPDASAPEPVQTRPAAHQASYTTGAGSLPGCKAAGAWCFGHPLPSSAEGKARVELYISFPSVASW